MHVRTDHEECAVIVFCDHCIMTTNLATYSPVFTDVLTRVVAMHAACAQNGAPDFTDIDEEAARQRAKALYDGFQIVHKSDTIDLVRT